MDFIQTMQSLFGFNPASGETLPAGRGVPTPRLASGALPAYQGLDASSSQSQEAADPSTPSPTGQVLAQLRTTPRRLGPPGSQPAAAAPAATGGQSFGDNLAGDLAGGFEAIKPGMSRGHAFLAGFSGTAKNIQARAAAASKAQADADKAKLDVYKALFDIQDKQEQRARGNRQDAETARWHNIMAPSYSSDKSKDKPDTWDDLSASDQSNAGLRFMKMAGIPDMSKPDGQAAWDMLKPEEQQKRVGILRRLQPALAKKLFDADGAPTGAAPPAGPAAAAAPKPGKSKPAAKAADAEDDDEEGDSTPAAPVAPVAPAAPATAAPRAAKPGAPAPAQTAPTPAAPEAAAPAPTATWRRYKAQDGSIKLFNPATGQTQALDAPTAPQAQPSYQEEYEQQGRVLGGGN